MILLLSFMPNSPRFLLSKGRDDEALQALTWLRADSEVHWEFEQIQDNVRRQVQHGWDWLIKPRQTRLCVALDIGCLYLNKSGSCQFAEPMHSLLAWPLLEEGRRSPLDPQVPSRVARAGETGIAPQHQLCVPE